MKYSVYQGLVILGILLNATFAHAQATINSLDQNADQSQGQYPAMNMDYAGIGSLGMMQSAWLDPLQNLGEGQSKPAYSKYYWSPDLVLPIRVRAGMLTLINFPEWEMVESVYIGDQNVFDVKTSSVPNSILLFMQPGSTSIGVDTNMMVFGRSGNKYVFYVRSEGINTERLTNAIIDIDVVGGQKKTEGGSSVGGSGNFGSRLNASNYAGGDDAAAYSSFTRRYQKEDWIQSIPLDPSKMKFDVEVYVPNPDDVVIAPERVWRDDIFTYIDLGEKALNMVQRPIVTLIVERTETPVGFRTKGPNNRLIVVEGVGDMVLRNGKRIICLKLRRSDDAGIYNIQAETNDWQVPAPIPSGMNGGNGNSEVQGFSVGDADMNDNASSMWRVSQSGDVNAGGDMRLGQNGELLVSESVFGKDGNAGSNGYRKMYKSEFGTGVNIPDSLSGYRYGVGFENSGAATISVELGTDADVSNLENLWSELSRKYHTILKSYQPFYSVDAPADGQGKELFHLRIGPVPSIDDGDDICSKLGRNGVFCSVVRIQ